MWWQRLGLNDDRKWTVPKPGIKWSKNVVHTNSFLKCSKWYSILCKLQERDSMGYRELRHCTWSLWWCCHRSWGPSGAPEGYLKLFLPVGGTLHSLRPANAIQPPSTLAKHKDRGSGHLNLGRYKKTTIIHRALVKHTGLFWGTAKAPIHPQDDAWTQF